MEKMKTSIPLISLLFFSTAILLAQEPDEVISSDTFSFELDMFEYPYPMDITLTFDMKAFQRDKNEDVYRDVHFEYRFNDSLTIRHTMRMKPRGNFRRSQCTYVPFWLNIRKADVRNKNLQEVKKFKVVSQCRGGKDYSEYVLKEYLAYKIYNLLSPVSFRVRLARMSFVDTGRKNRVTHSWAFIIEPEGLLAERLEALVVKNDELSMRLMKPEDMDLAAQFQYMIGNPDYSVAGRHNMKILGLPGFGSEGYTPVPYDFDYAGIVNASYAVPGENLGISSVRQRYYLGLCREDADYQKAIDHILDHREEIRKLVSDFPYLSTKHKKEMLNYLEGYFESTVRPGFIRSNLRATCR
jgi:hypothetical protein